MITKQIREIEMTKGVVLISGGLDSAVVAYKMKKDLGGFRSLYAITFSYGQRHESKETPKAYALAHSLGIPKNHHPLIPLDLSFLNKVSSLVGKGASIPSTGLSSRIPSTWVPQRNTIFLAYAFAFAEAIKAKYVYAGMSSIDYSGYPDCRPDFLKSVEESLNLGSKKFVESKKRISLVTPLLLKTKKETIEMGLELGVPFENTWSCYRGGDKACGVCDSCRLRQKGFKEVGLKDPLEYRMEVE